MSSAIDGRDVVDERQDMIISGIYELERDLCQAIISLCLEIMSGGERLLRSYEIF